jgi:hypothetical protein
MKLSILSPLLAVTLAVILCACSTVNQKEQFMSAAGFRTVIPSTPKQIAQLKSLPQDKVIPVNKKGQTIFLFADAAHNTMLIGTQSQYNTYRQYCLQYKITESQENAAALNADAAEWGCWGGGFGPWGPGIY